MRYFLFFSILILPACGQEKSSQNNANPTGNNTQVNEQQAESIQIETTVEFVTGQFDYRSHDDFVETTSQHAYNDIYLQRATYAAFKNMFEAAAENGITLSIISGTRNFSEQKAIWERKWQDSDASSGLQTAKSILEFSSMPMTSRHHWGTDIDINDLNNSYFESGQGQKEYEWLKENANDFGFYQPYTNKRVTGRTGYNEEKWHWSYMPLASPYLAYYNRNISNSDIKGFKGSELAGEIGMVENYVNGVSVKVKEYER